MKFELNEMETKILDLFNYGCNPDQIEDILTTKQPIDDLL